MSRLSRSLSDHVEAISQQMHKALDPPTMIHRKNSRTKPVLPLINTNLDTIPQIFHEPGRAEITNSSNSFSPSAFTNSSTTPVSKVSTGQTSLYPNSVTSQKSVETRMSPEQHRRPRNKSFSGEELPPIEETGTRYLTIPCQETPVSIIPSVTTVESATAAKVFFETQFHTLISELESPRSLRRKQLEQRLLALSMSTEEREQLLRMFFRAESDHLRQVRVLKSTSLARHEIKGISIAGYEAVRVLGKGSFGIVRLVTEMSPDATPCQDVTCSGETLVNDSSPVEKTTQQVSKAVANTPKEVYAMKVIRKSDMLRNCQEGHLRAERDLLVASEGSKWVVPLIASFQDNTNLYLVMEYEIGGDFLGMLLREDMLDEWVARWYIAEMILCIEEAHKMNWIHRDIKPDNFLISASGHLKISDFGLAFDGHWSHSQSYYSNHRYTLLEKLGISIKGDEEDIKEDHQTSLAESKSPSPTRTSRRKQEEEDRAKREGLLNWRDRTERKKLARSVVGTSQYMAPEVILGQPYDGRCDWWSVGVILYEVRLSWPLFLFDKTDLESACMDGHLFPARTGRRRRRILLYVHRHSRPSMITNSTEPSC